MSKNASERTPEIQGLKYLRMFQKLGYEIRANRIGRPEMWDRGLLLREEDFEAFVEENRAIDGTGRGIVDIHMVHNDWLKYVREKTGNPKEEAVDEIWTVSPRK